MKKNSNLIILVSMVIFTVSAISFSLVQMYNNSKTDGYGGGSIRVDQCKVDDAAWKIYTCSGFYKSTAGLVEVKNAKVIVMGKEYISGEYIDDVYPTASIDTLSQDPRSFVTGRERSSVEYNAPWLAMLFVGLLLPLGLALYTKGHVAVTSRAR